ncbi:efflux RND transporter permease subunit [Bacillus marinisedimentorum]|uniref:efflux RND transporter permease subunit n=1 Tax=Bacillus marinisedimentorum TaxID=1821260 RepID=UPI0007DFB46A|nr:efflux RND transporter permease subunit [Bacillus marinisedimentorum]
MSWLTKWAFRNKAAISLTTVLILILGVVSYFTMPMEFLPEADNPQVTVVVLGQGNDVESMVNTVTEPIETSVTAVKGKREVYSTTGDGFSKVDIMFEPGTDMKQAKTEVQEAVNGISLPEGTAKPHIVQLNTTMIPIADISISFADGLTKENLELANKKMIPAFKDIDGIGSVAFYGKNHSAVTVEIEKEKLAKARLTPEAIFGALQGQNTTAAVGQGTIDGKTSNIIVAGTLDGLDDLKNVGVAPGVKLGDVASINTEENETGTITRLNGEDSLVAVVTKDSNSNAVAVVEDVKKTAEELTAKYEGAEVTVFFATADMIVNSVNSMMREVLLGALFATLVIMFFLRNLRSTFITIVSIPLSLGFTLFLLSQSGITLNILTIGGVAVAVGRLVDDSIVVIENIFRRMQKHEEFSVKMIVSATREVGSAITSSTLTTVAVFLPISLVGAGLQEFFLPFALTVSYSLLSSLVVALTVVPLMSAGLLKNASLPVHQAPKRFIGALNWSLNHKWVILLTSFVLFAGSIGAYFMMPKGAIDSSDAEIINVSLAYPNNKPLAEITEKADKMEAFLLDQDGPKYVFTQMGNSDEMAQYGNVGSPTTVVYTIIMEKGANAETFMKNVRAQQPYYSDAKLTAAMQSLMGGSGSAITIDVAGANLSEIEETAAAIQTNIKGFDGIEKLETNEDEKKTVYTFDIKPGTADPQQVSQQLGMMINKMPIGTVNMEGTKTPVMLEPIIKPETKDDLENIQLATPAGIVPVSSIAAIKSEEKSTQVLHKEGDPYIRITAAIDPKKLSVISGKINNVIKGAKPGEGMDIPDGIDVLVGGASAQQAEDFTDLFITMGVSIGLVYLIMVITFKTLRAPIAILFSLPLATIGAVLGLIVSRIPVDITALLGALMLIGVVVTNAIVLLDRVKQNEETMIIREAILEAAGTRMRPILMTATATIFAMLPLLFRKAEMGSLVSQSLAVVVIGGLAVSTMLTLIVIPTVYELLYFRKSKRQRLEKELKPAEPDIA